MGPFDARSVLLPWWRGCGRKPSDREGCLRFQDSGQSPNKHDCLRRYHHCTRGPLVAVAGRAYSGCPGVKGVPNITLRREGVRWGLSAKKTAQLPSNAPSSSQAHFTHRHTEDTPQGMRTWSRAVDEGWQSSNSIWRITWPEQHPSTSPPTPSLQSIKYLSPGSKQWIAP